MGLDEAFMRTVATADTLSSVETLVTASRVTGAGPILAAQTSMPALRRLHFRTSVYYTTRDDLIALCDAPWFDRLETYEASATEGPDWYDPISTLAMLAERPNALPSLRHLILGNQLSAWTFEHLTAFDHITRLTLRPRHPDALAHNVHMLTQRGAPALHTLDLSQTFEVPREHSLDEWSDAIVRIRPFLEVLAGDALTSVELGPYAPAHLLDTLPAELVGPAPL